MPLWGPADGAALVLGVGHGDARAALLLIAVLGIGAQWLAWRLRFPSILLLLGLGFMVGPGAAWIPGVDGPLLDADAVFGDLLLPLVGIGVGLILYEGGLTLRLKDIRGAAGAVFMLVTVGAAVTWGLATLLAWLVLGLPVSIAALLGAVLIVTGPTVVGPLLAHVRPAGLVGPVLRWEGIVIDPIGALAAVLTLEVLLIGHPGEALGEVAYALVMTVVVGGGLGLLGAALITLLSERFWMPESLQNPASLALAVIAYLGANALQAESGLLATTVMGIALANQRRVDIRHLVEFKENLRVLIIGTLFIVLASRVRLSAFAALDLWAVAGFVALMIVVVRPAGVLLSTVGSRLQWRERAFVSLMAPRGIVAAAVASVFALSLERAGMGGAGPDALVAVTFLVIVGTVLFYGLSAPAVARLLGVADHDPQGVLFVGASEVARALAGAVAARGVAAVLVDTNRGNVAAAQASGLDARHVNVLDEQDLDRLDLRGIGRALALTPNAEVNTLALQRLERLLGKANVYGMPVRAAGPRGREGERDQGGHGRRLFDGSIDLATLEARFGGGWLLRATALTDEFPMAAYQTLFGLGALVMFVHGRDGRLRVCTPGRRVAAEVGDTLIALVDPEQLFMPMADVGSETEG